MRLLFVALLTAALGGPGPSLASQQRHFASSPAPAAVSWSSIPPCHPFCPSSHGSLAQIESRRYPAASLGNLEFTNPLIGTQGPDPSEYGGMVPSLSSPFASTRLIPMTRENKVSGVPYHFNDTSSIGAIISRQPAIWMGDYGHVALWSTARGEDVKLDVHQRAKPFDRERDEYAKVWKYAVRLGGQGPEEEQVVMELAGKSRAHMVQFTYPDLPSTPEAGAAGVMKDEDEHAKGPAISSKSSRASWRGGVEIDVDHGEVSGYNTERMDYRLGPNQALDFKGWYVARIEHQLQGSDQWIAGFASDGHRVDYGTVHTNSSGTTLHPAERARWNDLGVYGYVRLPANVKRARVRIGMSLISKQQAAFNLEDEMPDGTELEDVVQHSIEAWRKKVDRIQVQGGEQRDKTILFTAMVRASVYPAEHAEVVPPEGWKARAAAHCHGCVDGCRSGSREERQHHYYSAYTDSVHRVPKGKGTQRYQSFSIWDIYRAQWSTLILFEPERVADMVRSMLDIYDESGRLPMWANLGETNIMIGTHADSLIAEAALKGISGFDADKAWRAVLDDATVPPEREGELRYADREEYTPLEVRAGLSAYEELGYVPLDQWDESTSRTLDYAYDDAAVAVLARLQNRTDEAERFERRSKTRWRNVFDPSTGMACARHSNGSFLPQPLPTPQARQDGFTEGNMFDYTFAVPHDVKGLISYLSPSKLVELLRRHFDEGHNNISNEPSQHIPYLYSYLDRHGDTHRIVRQILGEGYGDREDGITGNEDCGQMSSWYLWNAALGVYPMNPVSGEVVVGGGMAFERVEVRIPPRRAGGEATRLTITAEGLDEGRVYTRGVEVNGQRRGAVLRWQDLVEGGEWAFDIRGETGPWEA
ncbi:uncharacterized protein PSFLO_03286 [Pseudozyma flocculosa]|uniref:Alpha-1,2-mannosidase n=1 Tax=Pseudozyma flocculosa TaxID=84751 RepID=A0A5C3F173_9BASI|nr:uncharacterized protein PSFLO_03286 [Pseudozyma flocculosa]